MFFKSWRLPAPAAALLSVACVAGATRADTPLTPAFIYQGQLQVSGTPYTGTADIRFTLWPDSTAGSQVGNASVASDVNVANGIFTATVNANGEFGAGAFTGDQRWLKIGVRTPHDPTNTVPFTALTPREPLAATPYALALELPYGGAGTTPAAPLILIQNAGAGQAISGESATGHGVVGKNGAGSGLQPLFGYGTGVWGDTDNGNGLAGTSGTGFGVYGAASPVTGLQPSSRTGVVGDSHDGVGVAGLSSTNVGVYGIHGVSSGIAPPASSGLLGESRGQSGVIGLSATGTAVIGVSGSGTAVKGQGGGPSGLVDPYTTPAVWGDSNSADGIAGLTSLGNGIGVYGLSSGYAGVGVWGMATANPGGGVGVYGASASPTGFAGEFNGNVNIIGTLTKTSGSFKIDDPIDPANKYLSHSFVESPDMMNVYNGNVTTDDEGYATVSLPAWFEALNQDFRYQLTIIDESNAADFAQAKIVKGIEGNRFTIRTSCPRTTVSWQVTGIRHDAYAVAHRIPVEEDKPAELRGLYLNPAEFGLPPERGVAWREANNHPRAEPDAKVPAMKVAAARPGAGTASHG